MRRILVTMADRGPVSSIRCRMEECYHPIGRDRFDKKTHPPTRWAPSADHFPILKSQGGCLTEDNVRLSHILCNNLVYSLRTVPVERWEATKARWRKKYSQPPSD